MATTLGIFVSRLVLVSHGRILVIEPLLRILVTRIIRHRPLTVLPYLSNFGLLNLLCINHESRDIHVIKKHSRMTLFLHQARHSHHKFFILALGLASIDGAY